MTDILFKILPGLGEMMNIHPLLVHFPIAMLNAFVLLEMASLLLRREDLKNAATWVLYIGAAGAVAAVVAGLHAAATVPHGEEVHAIMTRHRNFGLTVMSVALVLAGWRFFREGSMRLVQLAIGIAMVIIMTVGADLGGLMVYKHGVAVRAVEQPGGYDHSGLGQDDHQH